MSHRNCYICGKPIVLEPSAKERSRATGYPASFFRALFTTHSECAIRDREERTIKLMRRINRDNNK